MLVRRLYGDVEDAGKLAIIYELAKRLKKYQMKRV